jgi:hypothetical protein
MQFGKKFQEKADAAALKLAADKVKSAGSAKAMDEEAAEVAPDLTCPACGHTGPAEDFEPGDAYEEP